MLAKKVTFNINDPELRQWSHVNQFARVWHCKDLRHSPILKLAIKKAINKTEHHNKERGLFVMKVMMMVKLISLLSL